MGELSSLSTSDEMAVYFRNLYRSKSPLEPEAEKVMAAMRCTRCPKCSLWVGEEDLDGDGCNCCPV